MKIFKYILPVLLLWLSSCSLQKRVYRNGFYVGVNKHKQKQLAFKTANKQVSNVKGIKESTDANTIEEATQPVYASIQKGIYDTRIQKNFFTGNCDTIFFRNGKRSVVKVLEVNQNEVKYKLCNSEESPLFVFEINKVDSITFSNGSTESYLNAQPNNNPVSKPAQAAYVTPESEQIRHDAKLTLIFGIVSIATFFLFGPVGLIFAILTLQKGRKTLSMIRKREKEFSNEYDNTKIGMLLARITLIVGLVLLALILFIMLLASGVIII